MTAEIIRWDDYVEEPVCQCSCGCTQFYIRCNGYGRNWDKIVGTQCVECDEKIDWVIAEKCDSAERKAADDGKD